MPIHDWIRVEPGDFHHFHHRWISALCDSLNGGLPPPDYMALAEQVTGRPIPDVVTLQARQSMDEPGGIAVALAPPTARVIARFEKINYAKRADRVVIRHGRGRVVAIIEIVSPGNKDSRHAPRTFVEKAADILNRGQRVAMLIGQGAQSAGYDPFADSVGPNPQAALDDIRACIWCRRP
jgi:hypothetical protein